MLLLLDNCEHGDRRGASLRRQFSAEPGVNILATSRELLRVTGERGYVSDRSAVRTVVRTIAAEAAAFPGCSCSSSVYTGDCRRFSR